MTIRYATVGLALLVGCQGPTTKIGMSTGDATTMPAGTAIVRQTGGVGVASINGQSTTSNTKVFPAFRSESRFEVPAGPCTLELMLDGRVGNAAVSGGPKRLAFTAEAGHTYSLRSRVVAGASGALPIDRWDATLVDDSAFVAETTDMRAGQAK